MMSTNISRRSLLKLLGASAAGGFVLAACAPSPAAPSGAPDAEAANVTTEAVTVTHWDFGGGQFEYIDQSMVPDFKERYPDIEIDHVGIPEDGFATKLKSAVSANTQPDVAMNSDNSLWKAGLCVPLNDLLAKEGINWQEDYYMPIVEISCIIDDGNIYGMPVLAFPMTCKYNKDLFEAVGVTPPPVDTAFGYSHWYAFAKAVNKPADDIKQRVWGTIIDSPKWYAIKHAMAAPTWAGQDGHTAIGNLDSEGWIDMYQHMYNVWSEELSPVGDVTQGLGADPFRLGQLGFTSTEYSTYKEDLEAGLNVGVCQHPCVGPDKGAAGLGGYSEPWTIFKASKSPDQTWQWVHYLGTDGAVTLSQILGTPPMLKKLVQDMQWSANNPSGEEIVTILENLPHVPFTPNFRPIIEPTLVAWTRMTEEGVPVDEALHEAAAEVQELLDTAWEQWEMLAA